MNWQLQQPSQKINSYSEKQSVDNTFDSIYDDVFTVHHDFWMPLVEENAEDYRIQIDKQEMILQGKLFQKHSKTRKWESQHLELFEDKLVRVQQQPDSSLLIEFCRLNQCFMKKIQYSESSFQSYKYGIRLQIGKQKTEFFTESNDTFFKWHNYLKRYTILPKFSKKYKLVSKLKICEQFQAYSTYLTIKLADNFQYQVRVIEKHDLSEQQRLHLLREIKILRKLDHQYVIRLLELYEDANFLYMVFDSFAGREIKFELQDIVSAPEKVVAELMFKLLQGLSHCHSKNVFHRDLKFDTIFQRVPNSITEICIVNFSTAEIHDPLAKSSYKKIGTPGFLAPEMFKSKQYDPKVDIFSLGIIFYFFVFARMPFGNEYHEIMYNNEKGDIEFNQRPRFSSSAIDLISLMVKKDPNKRPNAFQALNHHWFINMKIKEQVSKNLLASQWQQASIMNLSTIIEKSDFLDVSTTSVNNVHIQQKKQPKPQTMPKAFKGDEEIGDWDDEFSNTSLQDKLKDLQILCPPKTPSRQKHTSPQLTELNYSSQKETLNNDRKQDQQNCTLTEYSRSIANNK